MVEGTTKAPAHQRPPKPRNPVWSKATIRGAAEAVRKSWEAYRRRRRPGIVGHLGAAGLAQALAHPLPGTVAAG